MNARLFTWGFVLMSIAFSLLLSFVTSNVFFVLLAAFPVTGKLLFGPRDSNPREEARAARRRNKLIFILALAVGIGILTTTLLTHEAIRMALASAAGLTMLVVIYVLMIFGAGRSIDVDQDDKYG